MRYVPLLFRSWLVLTSFVVVGILSVVPAGGRDYATLIYELGWFIFWRFIKYVEGDAEVSASDGAEASECLHELEGEGGSEDDFGSVQSCGTVHGDTSPEGERTSEHT